MGGLLYEISRGINFHIFRRWLCNREILSPQKFISNSNRMNSSVIPEIIAQAALFF